MTISIESCSDNGASGVNPVATSTETRPQVSEVKIHNEEGVVYFEGFNIERYFPLTEETIEEYACIGKISKIDFSDQ